MPEKGIKRQLSNQGDFNLTQIAGETDVGTHKIREYTSVRDVKLGWAHVDRRASAGDASFDKVGSTHSNIVDSIAPVAVFHTYIANRPPPKIIIRWSVAEQVRIRRAL